MLAEPLESRTHLSVSPTVYEQYLLALVNRARQDPAAEAALYTIALNEGVEAGSFISSAAKQPLAFNLDLNESARGHSQWMLDADTFSHTGAGGSSPGERDAAAGYVFTPPSGWGENLAYTGREGEFPELVVTVERLHRNLFVDEDIEGRGHRVTMLRDYWTESGVGIVGGVYSSGGYDFYSWMLTQEFATTAGNRFITGTVFADTVRQDAFYTPFEGLGNVTIEARRMSDGMVYTTQTWDAGGYSLQVPAGDYQVRAYGGDLGGASWSGGVVKVGGENVLVNVDATSHGEMPKLVGDGVVLVVGTGGDDVIRVLDMGERIRFERNGATVEFAKGLVNAVEIHADDGNDWVEVDGTMLLVTGISGDGGNDTVLGGAGMDYVSGDEGDDYVNGRFGADSLHGGDGHDLLEGRAGDDTVFGGRGRDTLLGGNHNDELFGGRAADYLDGESGDDTLIGGANSDTLMGGLGDDWFYARNESGDYIDGGAGLNRAMIDPLLDVVVNAVLIG